MGLLKINYVDNCNLINRNIAQIKRFDVTHKAPLLWNNFINPEVPGTIKYKMRVIFHLQETTRETIEKPYGTRVYTYLNITFNNLSLSLSLISMNVYNVIYKNIFGLYMRVWMKVGSTAKKKKYMYITKVSGSCKLIAAFIACMKHLWQHFYIYIDLGFI